MIALWILLGVWVAVNIAIVVSYRRDNDFGWDLEEVLTVLILLLVGSAFGLWAVFDNIIIDRVVPFIKDLKLKYNRYRTKRFFKAGEYVMVRDTRQNRKGQSKNFINRISIVIFVDNYCATIKDMDDNHLTIYHRSLCEPLASRMYGKRKRK